MNKKTLSLSALFIIGLALALRIHTNVQAQGLGNCDPGFIHKDESAPFGWTYLDGDMIIDRVIVKAGSQNQGQACFEFTEAPANDGCYQVLGLGTSTVTVIKVGDGPDCKDISHVEFFVDQESSPSPTPSPSATPDPTASPSPSPEVTPSPTPEVSPSPSPSATPTPTPSSSPSPSSSPKVEEKPIEQQMQEVRAEYIKEYGREPDGLLK